MPANIFLVIIFSCILTKTFGDNILVILPHISHTHFKATSKLAEALGTKGHNVTLVSPHAMETANYRNITEIYLHDIIEPVQSVKNNFNHRPNCYWSKLQYSNVVGAEYAKHILKNENITDLIKSNSVFDLVLLEDVSADALAIFSYVFKCPLVVLLSEPLSPFYENYFFDNNYWRIRNDLRNAHLFVLKELYREWIMLPEQNKIIRETFPAAPDVRELLYNTSLVLVPTYQTLSNLVPKYLNVKQIGGFHIDNREQVSGKPEGFLNNFDNKEGIFLSDDIPEENVKLLLKNNEELLQDVSSKSNIYGKRILGHPNIKLFIGNGDVYETASAIYSGIPVVTLVNNRLFQQFLIDILLEDKVAYGWPVDKLEHISIEMIISELLVRNFTSFHENMRLASQIIRTEQAFLPMDKAMYWIEYVLLYHGALHLRPVDLQSELRNHLIEIIIVLVIIDIALFLIFYWIFTHLLLCGILKRKLSWKKVNGYFDNNISYIRLDK